MESDGKVRGVCGWSLQGEKVREIVYPVMDVAGRSHSTVGMTEGQRKKAPVGAELLEVREEAAEFRPTGKNIRKD